MAYEYEIITNILKRYRTEKLEKINFFGVITYLGPAKTRNTIVTVVDNSCEYNEKLKCNIFINKNDIHTIRPTCNIGDIIRCHRFRVQEFNGQAQGVCYTASNWTRFKSDTDDFEYEGAKQNTTLDENDKKIITELREWLRTNPQLEALFEASLTTSNNKPDENINEDILNAAANTMHMNDIKDTTNKIEYKDLIQFFKIQPETYIDIVCQVCSVGYHAQNNSMILSVWDGTKTNYTVYREQEIHFGTNKSAYFSKTIVEQTYQIFIFDEYIKKCESIQPGDFILLRNQHAIKYKNIADLIFKMPSGGSKYNRNIIKLASHNLTFENNNYNYLISAVKTIHEKAKEFDLKFMCLEEYKSCFQLNLNDNTMVELLNQNESKKPALTKVDMLLNDESIMYEMTDDESTRSSNADQNKENKIMESCDNTNLCKQIVLNTSISPIKTNEISNILTSEENKKETTVSTSTQIVKKQKIIDPYEICSDIFKIKRLTLLTYLVPSYSCDLKYLTNIESIPFFVSIDHLKKHAEKENFMRCKIEAKIFKYSFNSCPQMSCVFVNCKKCNYVNFTPFNLATIHQREMMNVIVKDLKSNNYENQSNDLDENKNALNFSLNWIHSAMAEDFIEPSLHHTSQQSQQQEQNTTAIMYYSCPRCTLLNESEENSLLDYNYRFWFDLRDANSSLDPVLIEGQVAESLLNITPIKYYTDKNKAHQVYQMHLENFEKRYIFTIDTFKLPNEKKYHINKKLNVLYKIVDMTEIKVK